MRDDMILCQQKVAEVLAQVNQIVIGKEECVRKVMAAILAGGHILLEDIPGVGKTTLAMAFSETMALQNNRLQFTPDVMPSDLLGFSMYQKQTGTFEYQTGAVMCNLFLGDEINRTSPKTQSALLEVMEEGNVTVDGVTRKVPEPFVVIATENPAGSVGTQLLPESQLDRFMICTSLGYPSLENEIAIVKGHVHYCVITFLTMDIQDFTNIKTFNRSPVRSYLDSGRSTIKSIVFVSFIYRHISSSSSITSIRSAGESSIELSSKINCIIRSARYSNTTRFRYIEN